MSNPWREGGGGRSLDGVSNQPDQRQGRKRIKSEPAASQREEGPPLGWARTHLVLQLCDLSLEVADVLAGVAVVELALDLPLFLLWRQRRT